MPNVTITIGTPVLVVGEHFKVRYRILPNGSFSAPQNESNAPFTLTGLSAGSYELEVIVVKADGSECPPTYQIFDVVEPFECIEFEAEMIAGLPGQAYLTISYTIPGGFTNPACGWDIVYNGNTVHYATLPTSPIQILVPNNGVTLHIIADSCNGNRKYCFNDDVPPAEPTCTPISITNAIVGPNPGSTINSPNFSIQFTFAQSTPCTVGCGLTWKQINVLPPNIAPSYNYPYPTFGIVCSTGFILLPIAPNTAVQWVSVPGGEKRLYEFEITITDVCGKTDSITCSFVY